MKTCGFRAFCASCSANRYPGFFMERWNTSEKGHLFLREDQPDFMGIEWFFRIVLCVSYCIDSKDVSLTINTPSLVTSKE